MSVFACYHGDCDHLALVQPGCFALEDAKGRRWLCVPAPEAAVDRMSQSLQGGLNLLASLQERALRAGLPATGCNLAIHRCAVEELRQCLGEETVQDGGALQVSVSQSWGQRPPDAE